MGGSSLPDLLQDYEATRDLVDRFDSEDFGDRLDECPEVEFEVDLQHRLPADERAEVVEQPLSSFAPPDSRSDRLWAQEAEHRVRLFESGQVEAFPAEDVFDELDQRAH